jgi:hypothetical protein
MYNKELQYHPEAARAADDSVYSDSSKPSAGLKNCYCKLIMCKGHFKLQDTENENNYETVEFRSDADDSGLEQTITDVMNYILDNQIYVVNKESFEFLDNVKQQDQNTLIAEMDVFDPKRRDIIPTSFEEFKEVVAKTGDAEKMNKSPKGFAKEDERLKHYQNSDIQRTDHFTFPQFNSTYRALDKSKGKEPESEETHHGKWKMKKTV